MKRLVFGMLAHVDAGKTTLSEALLFKAGALRRLGRVDRGDAFLDTHALERARGITIFSKQALFALPQTEATLLDTPGHVDFAAEMERTLRVLDYAVLVINATQGVQSHTETLWRLLVRYNVPTFLFMNKMDIAGLDNAALLAQLRARFGEGFADFSPEVQDTSWQEQLALCDEGLMNRFLEQGSLSNVALAQAIAGRRLFPCYFGSALRLTGVEALLHGLDAFTCQRFYPPEFGAQVFKIAQDEQGNRLPF